MKICCVYHSRDLDGWMSAAITKLAYGNIDLIGYDYGDDLPDLDAYDWMILVDIAFPIEVMTQLAIARKIKWIDHHISAILEWQNIKLDDLSDKIPQIEGIRNTQFAACELCWQFFFPDKQMPEIVRLLGRYDCFGHKGTAEEKTVLEFQYAARTYWTSPDHCYEALLHDDTRTVALFTEIGMGIHKYLCTEAKQIYSKRFDLLIDGYKFGCVNRERFNPINFGINYHSDGYDGFMCFWYDGKKYSYSLYNDNGQVDCSEIAKRRGGGGHKGASGFVIEMSIDTIKL